MYLGSDADSMQRCACQQVGVELVAAAPTKVSGAKGEDRTCFSFLETWLVFPGKCLSACFFWGVLDLAVHLS